MSELDRELDRELEQHVQKLGHQLDEHAVECIKVVKALLKCKAALEDSRSMFRTMTEDCPLVDDALNAIKECGL